MAPLGAAVVVPVAKKQMVKDHGFYFGFRLGFIARFVAGIVRAAGIHLRDKNNIPAVWRPDGSIGLSGDAGDLTGNPARHTGSGIKSAHPDLGAAFQGCYEEIALSIRRPPSAAFAGG